MLLNPIAVAVLLLAWCLQPAAWCLLPTAARLTGRHEGLMSLVPLLRLGSVADGGRVWMVMGVSG
jgi:hypothetical protein